MAAKVRIDLGSRSILYIVHGQGKVRGKNHGHRLWSQSRFESKSNLTSIIRLAFDSLPLTNFSYYLRGFVIFGMLMK